MKPLTILILSALLTIAAVATSCSTSMETFHGHRYNIQRNPRYSIGDTVRHKHNADMVYVLDSLRHNVRHYADAGRIYYAHALDGERVDYLPIDSYQRIGLRK